MKRKKCPTLSLVVFIAVVLSSLLAAAGDSAHGGTGFERNQDLLILGDLHIKLSPLPIKSVPGYELYAEAIRNLPVGTEKAVQGKLVQAAHPNLRKYFRVEGTADVIKRIKEKYLKRFKGKVSDDLLENMVVYAYTNPATRETYLLPKYFELANDPELGEARQAAVIFHEAE